MKLQSIQLRHTYHFADLSINFDSANKPITLIMGDQGSGKTAIIKNIYQALTWFPSRLKDLRTAGVVMLDQDIMNTRVQSKIDLKISIPTEIGTLTESPDSQTDEVSSCAWQLYKTLNASGIGLSKVETQQLEQCVGLYLQAIKKDPLQGLPMIAYYPSERFVNDMNLLSKNNPSVLQTHAAYEGAAIPFTTFARFFEWLREISDIENAQTAQLFHHIILENMSPNFEGEHPSILEKDLQNTLFQAQTQLHSPSLQALRNSLNKIFPELSDIYLEYHPKLQLMVTYQNQTVPYLQLSNTLKNWIALIGDIVRRLCLLNPASLFPCLEGDGILLIDDIDTHLDQDHAEVILDRLHQAFPQIQIIATGNRPELMENAAHFQCLKLENKMIQEMKPPASWEHYHSIYEHLLQGQEAVEADVVLTPENQASNAEDIFQQIQQMDIEQQAELLRLLKTGDDQTTPHSLPLK